MINEGGFVTRPGDGMGAVVSFYPAGPYGPAPRKDLILLLKLGIKYTTQYVYYFHRLYCHLEILLL